MSEEKAYSTKKLGATGTIPVLPMLPVGAQISAWGGKVHYQMDASGHYLNGRLPMFSLSKAKAVTAAIKAQPKEPSYSETGSHYYRLDVCADPDHADRFLVKAGELSIGYGIIDPSVEIVSTDESLDSQIGSDDDEDDGGDNHGIHGEND